MAILYRNMIRSADDCVQKRTPVNQLSFFIGSSPSQASSIISPDWPAAGVMVSVNTLRKRLSDFSVNRWMLDSGAFTEISTHGNYRYSALEYAQQIERWSRCGNLLIAASQDWMCEPFILERTGLSVAQHQKLTIERYDQLVKLTNCPIMPVLQGYRISEYLSHVDQYSDRLKLGQWVGVGSVCRRNSQPDQIYDLLASIKNKRPDLKLHGFGLKQTALEFPPLRSLLYSCDSMAWSYPRKFQANPRPEIELAHAYQQRIQAAVTDSVQKRIPRTAGAGNGQGRKPKWKRPTTAIRVPAEFADELMALAREWDLQR
jgi:hypothetical protein